MDFTAHSPRLLLIGAGNMGGALHAAWRQTMPHAVINVVDPRGGDGVYTSPHTLPQGAPYDALIVAVKPQVIADVAPACRPFLSSNTVIISIAAGVPISRLQTLLEAPTHPMVRAMPNLAITVGEGMTGLYGVHLTPTQQTLAETLFTCGGKAIWLQQEEQIDTLTAISGSGPAYLFHMVEALTAAAESLGFSSHDATLMARQTIIGSAAVLTQTTSDAGTLRAQVTSPAGTTAAALEVLMPALTPLLQQTTHAAAKRAAELAKF